MIDIVIFINNSVRISYVITYLITYKLTNS